MKTIKSVLCSAVLAGAVFVAPSSYADSQPVVYVNAYESHFAARVYQDGKPVKGAVVKVYSGLESTKEGVTDSNGRINFYSVSDAGTFKAVAETPQGTSEPRFFRPKS